MKLKLNQSLKALILISAFALWSGGVARAQGTATGLSGLFYTAETAAGGLQGSGQDTHWSVGYASVAGAQNPTYQGAAYVINPVTGQGYVGNTTNAGWITAPAAMSAQTGGTANTGGDYLPGNGNANGNGTGTNFNANEGIYVYTLAFQIQGTVANGNAVISGQHISMSLTIAADDQYQVYINAAGTSSAGANNPAGINPTNFTATQAGFGNSAWGNTNAVTVANYTGTGTNTAIKNNSTFVIGTNYLTIVVNNTNSITTTSKATDLNPSGLLLYQTSNVIVIGTSTVAGTLPEVGTWLPIAGALGLLGVCRWRRRGPRRPPAAGS